MEPTSTLFLVLFLVLTLSIIFLKSSTAAKRNLPPGPTSFPVIGNIHQIEKQAHRSLFQLSEAYGPIMSLYLGKTLAVVVSSPEIAKEVVKTHDGVFSNRKAPLATQVHDHDKYSMGFLNTDGEWRKLRKVSKEHMFSTKCLDASQDLRQDMMKMLRDYVGKCCAAGRTIDVGEAAFVTTLNLTSATLFSTVLTDYESGDVQEFRQSIDGVVNTVGAANIADFFPILRPFDPQGIQKTAAVHFGKLLSIFEGMINQRLEARRSDGGAGGAGHGKKADMLEALVDAMESSNGDFGVNEIKHLLVDLYVGGADTTSSTVEWIMTELLRHPEVMSRVKHEIRSAVGKNNRIQEPDISKLTYFKAVIKETLRYHPPGAFLFPRMPERDVEINGYVIPKDCQVLVNIFALGRYPKSWPDPERFDPDRFVGRGKNVDFKGQDFELLPFGSGRRICPGLPFADRMMHLMAATLIHNFDWKLPPGMGPEDLDINEKSKLSLRKDIPLMAIPSLP